MQCEYLQTKLNSNLVWPQHQKEIIIIDILKFLLLTKIYLAQEAWVIFILQTKDFSRFVYEKCEMNFK